MFPSLPADVQAMFATVQDSLLGPGPNIRVGHLSEFGINPAMPCITVFSEGNLEGLTRGTYRHTTVTVDYWTGGNPGNSEGRRLVSLLYQYGSKFLQDANISGNGLSVQRFYETRASDPVFEPTTKFYHIANSYTLEGIASRWY
jgi:hypothetical protein